MALLSEKATSLTKNVVTYRKKTKNCYSKKMPTPFEFWDSELKSAFHAMDETAMSSMALTKQINDFIDQCFSKFGEELAQGTIPDKVASGIEFYINYVLRIIQMQASDEEINKAVNTHSNTLDALTDYSIGNMISTMKLLFHALYNPLSGALLADREHFHTYIQADIQSFTTILITRLVHHFPRLADPVFAQLLQSTVADAVFIQASPIFQDVILSEYCGGWRDA